MLKRLGFNSLWLLVARVGAQFFSLVFVALVARHLGVAGFGQYSLAAALVYLGNTVTTFGTDTLLIRETARQGQATRLVRDSLYLQLSLALLWIIGQGSLSLLLPWPEALRLAMGVYSLALVPLAVYTVSSALLRGSEKMDLFSRLSLAASILQVVVAVGVTAFQGDLVALCLGLLIAHGLLAILAWALTADHWRGLQYWIPSAAASQPVDLIRAASPLALLTGLAVLSQRMGLFSVSIFAGEAATGLFSAASRLTEGLKLGHHSALGAMMPVLSKQDGDAVRLLRHSLWVMPLAGGVLALLVSVFAQPLITLLYGVGYEAAVGPLVILAWTLVPYTLNATLSLALVTQGFERALVKPAILSLLIAVPFFVGLTLQFGLAGAAWAVFFSECVQTILVAGAYRVTRPEPERLPMILDPNKPLFTAADLLARKRQLGLLPSIQPPHSVILVFYTSLFDHAIRKHPSRKIGGFMGQFHLLKRASGRVGLLGHFGIGAPVTAALVDELAAWGVKRFIGLGSAAGLQPALKSGDLILCSHARCADGASRHYLPDQEWVEAAPELLEGWGAAMHRIGQPYTTGGSWTMSAPYRELHRDALAWQQAGLLTVEMEAAALLAVAKHCDLPAACGFVIADSFTDGQWQYGDVKATGRGMQLLLDSAIVFLSELK